MFSDLNQSDKSISKQAKIWPKVLFQLLKCVSLWNWKFPFSQTLQFVKVCASFCRICRVWHLKPVLTFIPESIFPALTENQILRGRRRALFLIINNSMKANPGPILNIHKCDFWWGDILFLAHKLVKWKIYVWLYILEFLIREMN